MISVCTANLDSDLLKKFRSWVEAEWGAVDSFHEAHERALPAPLLALHDETLVGGLSFNWSAIPGTQELALWINTLLVAPQFRRRGIGSQLVAAAEDCAERSGVGDLYVYTGIPAIYRKLGWQLIEITGGNTVLKKALPRDGNAACQAVPG